jgi:hypothetical protein
MAELKPTAQMSYATGLIIQGNTENEKEINTDESWRVVVDKAYSFYRINHLKRYCASGLGEKFTGSLHPWNWETLDDKIDWKYAKANENGASLKSLTQTGRMETRMLFPRNILTMEAKIQNFEAVRRTEGIKDAEALLSGETTVN